MKRLLGIMLLLPSLCFAGYTDISVVKYDEYALKIRNIIDIQEEAAFIIGIEQGFSTSSTQKITQGKGNNGNGKGGSKTTTETIDDDTRFTAIEIGIRIRY